MSFSESGPVDPEPPQQAVHPSDVDLNSALTLWRVNLRKAGQHLLNRSISRRADTSDIVQEGMIQVWQNMEMLNSIAPQQRKRWLEKVAQGHAAKLARRHLAIKRSAARTQTMAHETVDVTNDPFLNAKKNEEMVQLMKALATLEFAQQQVLFLTFFEGMHKREIAEKLGITYKSMRGIYEKALLALKLKLKEN